MDYELRYKAAKVLLISLRKAAMKLHPDSIEVAALASEHRDQFNTATEGNPDLYKEGLDVVRELIVEDVED